MPIPWRPGWDLLHFSAELALPWYGPLGWPHGVDWDHPMQKKITSPKIITQVCHYHYLQSHMQHYNTQEYIQNSRECSILHHIYWSLHVVLATVELYAHDHRRRPSRELYSHTVHSHEGSMYKRSVGNITIWSVGIKSAPHLILVVNIGSSFQQLLYSL